MENALQPCPDCSHSFGYHGTDGCTERHETGEISPNGVKRRSYCECKNDIRDLKTWLADRPTVEEATSAS